MSLRPGTRLGHYDVTSLIGEGGMGQVWQATDTQLGREVALKILPDAFAADPDRFARFTREAQILASLNHPNIAAIHGIEEAEGTRALVLELVEGPTLADRIAKGPVPLDEALPIAKQIAEALEAAHEAGVIHRDLKPANIKVREDGTVKVLDFGLAKALDPHPEGDPSDSPTLTAAATQMGVIMGTAAYMSPEQARGKVVDKRADIWAFGCVLYEMLTGRRAFEGEDVSTTLADVIRAELSWDALPSDLPPALGTYLRRCLEKDPTDRVRDVGDVRLALDGAFDSAPPSTEVKAAPPPVRFWQRPVGVAALAALAAVAGVAVSTLLQDAARPVSNRFRVDLASPGIRTGSGMHITLSRDGRTLVYATAGGLFARRMGNLESQPIPGAENGTYPFLSPDGEWVGFRDGSELKKVSLSGGPTFTLCECGSGFGASWGDDDTVVFGSLNGLYRVSANGGEPERLTQAENDSVHAGPSVLPGGRGIVFNDNPRGGAVAPGTTGQIAVYSFATGEYTAVTEGRVPRFSAGHLLFGRGDSLWAAPFDAKELALTGEPFLVVDGVSTPGLANVPQFAAALDGTLVYAEAGDGVIQRTTLVWVDREGREEELGVDPGDYYVLQIAPDGRSVAVDSIGENNRDILVIDLERRITTRLTFDPGADSYPTWTPDGARVIWSVGDGADRSLFWQSADGSGTPERLTDSPNDQLPLAVTPDGDTLLYIENHPETEGYSIDALSLSADRFGEVTQQGLLGADVTLSPDGRWLAYRSAQTGQAEVFVRPFPDLDDGLWQVSRNGGRWPVWGPDRDELFYRGPEGIMVVPVETATTFDHGSPELLFERDASLFRGGSGRSYDIAPNGERFLMSKPLPSAAAAQVVIVQNWLGERAE